MIKTTLTDISDVVSKYSELLSNILNLDIEVVDAKLKKNAKTGIYKNGVVENIESEEFVYKETLSLGKLQIIENLGNHFLCKNCKSSANYKEKMQR